MCSVIGYIGEYDKDVVERLMVNSRIRGLHSFGYAYYDESQLMVSIHLSFDEFIDSINSVRPKMFIAHFRYSTSGDYLVVENNQPILHNNICVAFNGVISQKSKAEMEFEYGLCLPNENDGYVLISRIDDEEFLKRKFISYALVGLEGGRMFALRNKNRPLYRGFHEAKLIYSSTKDILMRSGISSYEEVEPYKKEYHDACN